MRMHDFRGMGSMNWKNKRPMILLSTHALPIDMPGEPESYVFRRNGAIQVLVHTSPMHLEYTTYMRGMDVADQFKGKVCEALTLNYKCIMEVSLTLPSI